MSYLYFIDTGLACSLLGIRLENELQHSHFRGALFENYVVTELYKIKFNTGSATHIFYWRDHKGIEIDILLDSGNALYPIEIKSAQTFQENQLKAIHQWNGFSDISGGLLLYDGEQEFVTKDKIIVQNWRSIDRLKIH